MMENLTPKEIAIKYVYGHHDALTDKQEIEDMTNDINQLITMNYKDERIKKLESYINELKDENEVLGLCVKTANEGIDTLDSILEQVYNSSEYGMMESDIQRYIEFWQEKELKVIPPHPLRSLIKFG